MTLHGNFGYLAQHSPLLAELGQTAERCYPFDPSSCVLKLRLLAESLTQEMAARLGIRLIQPTQAEQLRAVDSQLNMDPQVRQMFNLLRHRGNTAVHQVQHEIGYREGLEALKVAREVTIWFHRTFGDQPNFKPGPFVLAHDPSQKLVGLQQQIADLQNALQQAQTAQNDQVQMQQLLQAQAEQEREMAEHALQERNIYESLAEEASERFARLKAEFDAKLSKSVAQPEATTKQVQTFAQKATEAAQKVVMDGLQHIHLTDLRKDLMPIPLLDEQAEIVCRVETLLAFADRLEARLQTAQTAAKRLTPSLLAKSFRGELVPQDPNDELASELLKRLTASTPVSPAKRGKAKSTKAV